MSFVSIDATKVSHLVDTETVRGTSNEVFCQGLKTVKQGGTLAYRSLNLGSTGELIDVGAVQLYGGKVHNQHASSYRYLKLYNTATPPTSSSVPVATIPIKPQSECDLLGLVGNTGMSFSLGLGIRATTGIADNDTGAPSTNDVVANLGCSSLGGYIVGGTGTVTFSGTGATVTGA